MSRRDANILRAAVVWTFYVWVTRIWNIWNGKWSFGFKAVHTVLAVVSIGFAVAIWGVVRRGRATVTRQDGTEPSEVGARSRSTPPSTH